MRYEIAFPNRAHHEAEIPVIFSDIGSGPLEVRMSRTSPGRYALHEFAKNVYGVRAVGLGEREPVVTRPDPHQWDIAEHGGEVTLSYTLYGDRADGTYTGIDRTHAHLDMPATFAWARGLEARPIELIVRVPDASEWRVATQLVPTDDPYRFTAPDLAYFLDSPTEVSDFWSERWPVTDPSGRAPQVVGVAWHHIGPEADAKRYARDVRAIVEATKGVFGAFPRFDHGPTRFSRTTSRGWPATAWSTATRPFWRTRARSPRTGWAFSGPWPTSSSMRGASSVSDPPRSSRSTSRRRTCRGSCGSARASLVPSSARTPAQDRLLGAWRRASS